MKRRGLTQEDQALWSEVTKTAVPLHRRQVFQEPPEIIAPPQKSTHKKKSAELPDDFEFGAFLAREERSKVHRLPSYVEQLNDAPLNMDHKLHKKMQGGKLRPEGKLDLHGLTLSEAHPELSDFILRSSAQGKRLVLVVTGKGKDKQSADFMPNPRGILRHQVPQWLAMPPMNSRILQVRQAHQSHGGGGAYYVYLRRL